MTTEPTTPAVAAEFSHIIGILSELNHANAFGRFLHHWESALYAGFVILLLSGTAFFLTRRLVLVPGRAQSGVEYIVSFFDDFICSILGARGRAYTPFIGTLFLYI